jgi:hypothetical protein
MRTAYVEGGLVVGHTRDDRGLALSFTAGDLAYATGRKEESWPMKHVLLRVSGNRRFEYGCVDGYAAVQFPEPREQFLLTVHVRGDLVRVEVEGKEELAFRPVTGLAPEGHVGFFLESGMVEIDEPAIRRHRCVGPWRTCACGHGDEPVELSRACELADLRGRRLLGVPIDPEGSFLVVMTKTLAPLAAKKGAPKQVWAFLKDKNVSEMFEGRVRILHPPGEGLDPAAVAAAWESHVPADHIHTHFGFPVLDRQHREALEAYDKRMAGAGPVDPERSRRHWEGIGAGAAPYLVVDGRGVIRGQGPSIYLSGLARAYSVLRHYGLR